MDKQTTQNEYAQLYPVTICASSFGDYNSDNVCSDGHIPDSGCEVNASTGQCNCSFVQSII